MEGFSHLLAQSIISININKRMLKDVYEGGISYYKVYTNEVNTTLIVNTNFSAFKVSVSRLFPFPNEKNYNSSENGLDKIEENRYGITLDSSYNRLLYISFEAVNKKEKQFIEIFSCENSKFSNCNLEYTSKIQWFIFAFVVVCFILGLIVYNLKCSYSIDQKQINIFG